MNDEHTEGTGGEGLPEVPASPLVGHDDVKISNTGQRIRAILVVLVVIVAAAGALYWWNSKKQEIERHEAVRTDFQKVHTAGYTAFWKESEVDIKEMKTNQDFEARLKDILATGAVRYNKHLKEKCLPVLEKALPDYKSLSAPVEYGEQVDAVGKAAEALYQAWKDLSAELDNYEQYIEANKKLDDSGNSWLGCQTDPEKEKFRLKAINYVKLVQCVLGDSGVVFEIEAENLGEKLEATCDTGEADWFRRVASECMPKLLGTDAAEDDVFKQTLEKYRKAETPDTKSVFGIKDCLKRGRAAMESEVIEKIALAWAGYVKAQNALLDAVEAKLKELR